MVGKFEIRVISNGGLTIDLTLLYLLLKMGGVLKGPYISIESDKTSLEDLLNSIIGYRVFKVPKVPTVNFCPSEEPEKLECADMLKNFCLEVYKYLDGKCAACVVKVYSLIYDEWLVSEDVLVKIFELSIKYNLPLDFNNGSIVITTCPNTYEEVRKLSPNSYIDGLKILTDVVTFLQQPLGL